ncbi:MAG: hypothetical protein P1P63_09655 [Treponemataceae bacterium]
MKKLTAVFCSIIFCTLFMFAQENINDDTFDNFGEFNNTELKDQNDNFSVLVGGEVYAGGNFFLNDFKTFQDTRASSLFWGKLHVEAKAPLTQAYFGIKLNDMVLPFNFKNKPELYPYTPQIPRFIDEGYMEASIGPVTFGGGLKKITWGKADAFSVLDVINSQDLSNPTISDMQDLKLARPMLYISGYLPKEMKLEAVFLPVFEGNTFATSGRWKPMQFETTGEGIAADIQKDTNVLAKVFAMTLINPGEVTKFKAASAHLAENFTEPLPIDSAKLKYSQAGVRYTVTVGGYHDLGFQYYYGFLPNPAFSFDTTKVGGTTAEALLKSFAGAFTMDYNPYHQVGFDYALAWGPLNFRLELAGNITEDLKGTKPDVYNPSLAWNVGLDYTTPIGLSLNLCAAENIKLMHKKIGTELYDVEKGSKPTDTKIMLLLSQPLLRDSINIKLRTIMACETIDFMMIPSLDWTFGTLRLDVQAGFFFGKKGGTFTQYKDNNYLGMSISYAF